MSDSLNEGFIVTTDKADYQPGETAVFTASNVDAGGTVEFSVAHVNTGDDGIYGTEDDLYTYDLTGTVTWSVTDGGEGDLDGMVNGVITTSWYVDQDAANEMFKLSATDTATGETATVIYTDADPVPAVLNNVANGLVVLDGNDPHGTGTGVFPSFVQIQGDNENGTDPDTYEDDGDSSTEEGFNTSYRPLVQDTDNSLVHNHNLVLLEVPLVEIDDVLYREFRLDLGEGGGAARAITLDSLKLYWSPDGSESTLVGLTEIYNMDGGADGLTGGIADVNGYILLSGWQSGQGASDYKFYIPESYFIASGVSSEDFIYLYSAFSNANSEFEEWSVADTGLADPDINIVKVTGASDGDPAPGDDIIVNVGDTIVWTYTITNTGNVALSNLVVTDDVLGTLYTANAPTGLVATFNGDVNDNDILETTETWVFTVNGVATSGSYSNIGTVSGEYLDEEVTDSDPSSYTGQGGGQDVVAIAIKKVTLDAKENATTADDVAADFLLGSDTDTILVGEAVTWIYKVTNAGTVDLTQVDVTDDQGVTVTYLTGDGGDIGTLEVGETWYYTATGVAVAATDANGYENIGTAVGRPAGGTDEDEVSDNDASGYFGADPSLTIEKSIVCDDGETVHNADTALFLLEDADGKVEYRIVVTNDGNVDLTDVDVEDLSLVDLGDADESGDDDGILSVGETWTYTILVDWEKGEHTNTATATASYTDTAGHVWNAGEDVSDSAVYFGADPKVDVEKLVSVDGGATWQDADTAPGPVLTDISPYDPMFKFVVHNTGNVELTDIVLHDNVYDLNGIVAGTDFTIASLAADDGAAGGSDTYTLTITVPWAAGQHTNTATASATFEDDCEDEKQVSDTDDANYLGFDIGVHGLTKGFWGQHLYAWDVVVATKKGAADTQALVDSHVLSHTDIFTAGGVDSDGNGVINTGVYGVLLGDANGDFMTNNGENTLFVALDAAIQIIKSSDSANDTRQILMSQALATQLNIYNGDADPFDLVGEAVAWLKGQAPYQYAGNSTGNVDTNGNGVLSVGSTNAFEYNTTTKAFTGDANFLLAGNQALTSNLQAWQLNVDVFNAAATTVLANGEDLKNALEAFNQDHLITSADGDWVGWTTNGGVTVSNVYDNNILDNFWLTLRDATSWV